MATPFTSKAPLCHASIMASRLLTPATRAQTSLTNTISRASRALSTSHLVQRQQQQQPRSRPMTAAKPLQSEVRRGYPSAASQQHLTPRSSAAAGASSPTDTLTWDEFFTARRRRRFANTGVSAAGAITATVFGSPLIGAFDIDTQVAQATGLDPIAVIAAGSFAVGVLGWFTGRVVGGVIFSLVLRQRGWSRMFAEKEKSFFDRIKRYRADPSSSSPQNPIPDYYGEKIGSVKDYRRWLKDQRAFTKKMYRGVR